MTSHRLVVSPYLVVLLCLVALAPRARTRQTEQLDLVLAGGRVLDPETGLDATRNVGIREGRIAAVTVEPLEARETLDVHGLVVAPGFIDLHAHGQDSESYRYYAHDGVTTALELELGTYPVASWYAVREGRSLINYGVSVAALQEVIADAAATGASLHVVHVTSMGQRDTPLLLQLIHGAREHGLDVTTEAYPYTAASTELQSAVFDPGWQQRMSIGYHDILYPATGERLTAASFARLRRQGAVVVIFLIPDSTVRQTLADSLVMAASDGLSPHGHPRLAGTHARAPCRYTRESGALSLQDAVRKMTLLPAQRLERAGAAMRSKGRIQVGADADITVFDPARVVDEATYERPAQFSQGIVHVLVNGVFVVRNGASVAGSPSPSPGRAIRRGS